MTALAARKYTLEEYLELDAKSEARLEYRNGEIFDMSGVNPEHDQIESNLNLQFRLKLAGKPCRMFLANTRIKVPSLPPYRYGDSAGLCGEPQYETIGGVKVLTNPALIIEILSDSTEAFDRGAKFTHYKSIPSFREYLLISTSEIHVTQMLKQSPDLWTHADYRTLEDVVTLTSIECRLSLKEIYEGLNLKDPTVYPSLQAKE